MRLNVRCWGEAGWPRARLGMGTSCLISSWQLGPLQHELGLISQARPHHRTPDMVLNAGRGTASSSLSPHLLLSSTPSTLGPHPIHPTDPLPSPSSHCLTALPNHSWACLFSIPAWAALSLALAFLHCRQRQIPCLGSSSACGLGEPPGLRYPAAPA